MSNISENLGQIDRRLLKVSKLEKNNALDMLDRWAMFLAVTQSIFWVFVTLCLSTLDVSVVPVSVCHLGVCHPLSVYSGCLCCTCLSLSFGCLSPFVFLLKKSLLYLSQSVIWVFVCLCLSTLDVSFVPVSVCHLGVCLSFSVYSGCLCCTCLSLSFECLSLFVCLLWMSLLYLSQSVIWVFVCLLSMSLLYLSQSLIWVFVTLCLSTLDVSVVPASVCLLGVCLSLSACSMCLLVYVSISLTLLSLFYWICRVLLFFLFRISGSGSGSQSVSGSEPFHTTVSTVYTFWKIANTICSKQLILRKHVLKNYTKIKSYEEGSEFKKMVNFPPSV